MKISVCVDAVYAGKDMRNAIDDVLANGLDTIEFWGWEDKDIQKLREYQEEKRVLCCGILYKIHQPYGPYASQ